MKFRNFDLRTAVIVSFLTTWMPAQSPAWTQQTPVTVPAGSFGRQIVYDNARQVSVMFGDAYYSNQTWIWNGISWAQAAPAASPPGRYLHAMAFDSLRQRAVLFGGSFVPGAFADTWEWDGANWSARFSASYPAPRYAHAMAYDAARQEVVLFGGSWTYYMQDTWVWNGVNWTMRSPSSSPSARSHHAMAYDATRQRVVLFGGQYPGVAHQDTWEWDGSVWTLRNSALSPSGRSAHSMCYDSARQKTILFGGTSGGGETWEWDGAVWAQASGVGPSPRFFSGIAYDSVRQRTVMFGGTPDNTNSYSDTWEYGGSVVTASATPYGAGCGLPPLGFAPSLTGRPVLGSVASAAILNSATTIAGVAMGWSSQWYGPFQLPVTLAGIGMPNCTLLQSADVTGLGTFVAGGGGLSFTYLIPTSSALLGAHVFIQAYAYAPGQNPLEITTSNGIDWLLGNS